MYEWLTGTLNGVDYIILKSYRKPVLNGASGSVTSLWHDDGATGQRAFSRDTM